MNRPKEDLDVKVNTDKMTSPSEFWDKMVRECSNHPFVLPGSLALSGVIAYAVRDMAREQASRPLVGPDHRPTRLRTFGRTALGIGVMTTFLVAWITKYHDRIGKIDEKGSMSH
ncbi:hypothetical protein HDE_05839 [Halotydeus destructor]|nr:hypothetical protein HDE_05839 [Halotydeus destructor]